MDPQFAPVPLKAPLPPVGISPQAHILLALINREILFWYPIKIMAVKRGWGGPITTGGGGDGRTVGSPFAPLSGEGSFV